MVLGRPLRQVRSIIRLNNGTGFTFDEASSRTRDDPFAVRRLLADLVTDEWIVQDRSDHWVITDKARELQTKSRGKLTRERADELLGGFMDRVHRMSYTDFTGTAVQYAFKVETVVVFGSYLTALPKIGDVDIAIRLRRQRHNEAEQAVLEKSAKERAPSGLQMLAELAWPETEVKRVLKAGSAFLELHDLSELEGLIKSGGAPKYKVLMGHWSAPAVVQTRETTV
jgi:hypothetical protein